MKYVKINAFDCPDAWYKTLDSIWREGELFEVRYGSEHATTKKLNISIEVTNPESRPLVDEKAPCDMKYVQWYALKYLWAGVIEDETYTYGSRLRRPVNQIEEAIKRIVDEPADRQITLVIRLPEDILKFVSNRRHEPPCLSLIDIEVFHEKINLTSYFRSWDAYAGLPANIAGIQLFNEAFTSESNRRVNSNLSTGKLVFHSKNCHIYSRQFNLVEDLLQPKADRRRKLFNQESSSFSNC